MSFVTCHMPHVTCHVSMSYVTCYVSLVTNNNPFLTPPLYRVGWFKKNAKNQQNQERKKEIKKERQRYGIAIKNLQYTLWPELFWPPEVGFPRWHTHKDSTSDGHGYFMTNSAQRICITLLFPHKRPQLTPNQLTRAGWTQTYKKSQALQAALV